jgi:hypothetical protein
MHFSKSNSSVPEPICSPVNIRSIQIFIVLVGGQSGFDP